jgi:CubicO group peptidase (beta-lactamase class C family)
MNSTFVETIDPKHERLAVGYGRRFPHSLDRALMPFTDCAGITPAANIATTVTDLAKFASFHLSDGRVAGKQLLRSSSLREMQRIHWLDPDWQSGWGLGFRILRQQQKTFIGHGGAVLGYRTQLQMCPDEKTAVIIFTNADDGEPVKYSEKVFQWITPALVKAAEPAKTSQQAPTSWQKYIGKYRDVWGDLQILMQNGQLTLISPSLPDPLLTAVTLTPVSDNTFRMETDAGFMAPGELAIFHLDEAGEVIALQTGETSKPRIKNW